MVKFSLIFVLLVDYNVRVLTLRPSCRVGVVLSRNQRLQSSENFWKSSKEEVIDLINKFLASPLNALNPNILVENAHILVNGKYEEVIDEKLNNARDIKESTDIRNLDLIVRGFITAERKSRSRLKVNYLLEGACTHRLEEAISLLSETDEIDEDLFRYIDSLIDKKVLSIGGPSATSEDVQNIEGSGKVAIGVLQMIQKRLLFEIKMQDRLDIKVLAYLLQSDDNDKRESFIRQQLDTVEKLEQFSLFLSAAEGHMTESFGNTDNASSKAVDDNLDKLLKIREISITVQKIISTLKTGLLDDNSIYSTSSADYVAFKSKEIESPESTN